MAEFAAASAAAGIISIGLDVCKGLFKYCDSLKTQSRDVKAASLQADRMEALLEILEDVIPQHGDSDPALYQVRGCLDDCRSGLRNLKAMLLKHTPGGSSKFRCRAAYPFNKSDISALKAVVSGLQSNLRFALDIYQLTSHARSAATQKTVSKRIQAMLRTQSDFVALDEDLRETRARHDEMHQMLLESKQQQEGVPPPALRSKILAEAKSSGCREGDGEHDEPLTRLANDAPHEEADEEIFRTKEFLPQSPRLRHRPGAVTQLCRCRPDHRKWTWAWTTSLRFESGSTSLHSPECPLYATTCRSEQSSIRLRYLWQCNRQAIGILVSLRTSIGLGGAVLNRALSCRRIVDFDHISFGLPISSEWRMMDGWNDCVRILNTHEIFELRKHVYMLLSSGVLFPTDMDSKGNTLFGLLCKLISSSLRVNADGLGECLSLLHELIDAGLPVDDVYLGRTPLSNFVKRDPVLRYDHNELAQRNALCLALLQRGACQPDHLPIFDGIVSASPNLINELELSILARALLRRSIPLLQEALACDPLCVEEQFQPITEDDVQSYLAFEAYYLVPDIAPCDGDFDLSRMSCLMAAVGWPKGLKALLEKARDIGKLQGLWSYALFLAFGVMSSRKPCYDSAKLLVEFGCPIRHPGYLLYYGTARDRNEGGRRWADMLIPALVDVMTGLKQLARTCLPSLEWQTYGLADEKLPDATAGKIVERLEELAISVPERFRMDRRYLFIYAIIHDEYMCNDLVEELWAIGFRDLECPSPLRIDSSRSYHVLDGMLVHQDPFFPLKPIGDWSWLVFADWAIRQGALGFKPSSGQTAKLLELAFKFGKCVQFQRNKPDSLCYSSLANCPSELRPFLRSWFEADVTDACCCRCTRSGCDALSLAIKGSFDLRRNTWLDMYASSQTHWTRSTHDKHPSSNSGGPYPMYVYSFTRLFEDLFCVDLEVWECKAQRIIRLLAFELTEQQHTCCTRDQWGRPEQEIDPERIDEVHEDHEEELERFEELVCQLLQDYKSSIDDMSFVDFLKGPFTRRIDEHWATGEEWDPDYVRALEALDVRICSPYKRKPDADNLA